MPERNDNGGRRRPARHPRRLWLVAIGLGLLALIICCLWAAGLFRDRRSADECLAEIEAARAIPDSENAATIYAGLFRDPKATTLLDYRPEFLGPPVYGQVMNEPWFDENHPELAAWIQEHQYIIDKLLDASHLEKSHFPVNLDIVQVISVVDFSSMRQWAFLLSFAANNDIAEGRNGDAVTKWGCILRMGNHLRQQPMLVDHLAANAIGRIALERIAWFVIEGSSTETHLRKIEAMPLPTSDHWAKRVVEIREVEALRLRKVMESYGLLDRIRLHFFLWRINYAMYGTPKDPDVIGSAGASYQRQMASARGIRILVALKRCQNATGRWPASLDEIRPSLSKEILTDPLNKGPFVYKPSGETFTLYSRGKNDIDENGKRESDARDGKGCDDWSIWPPARRIAGSEQGKSDNLHGDLE